MIKITPTGDSFIVEVISTQLDVSGNINPLFVLPDSIISTTTDAIGVISLIAAELLPDKTIQIVPKVPEA